MLYSKIRYNYLDSVWLSDYFPVEMSQVIGTTISVRSQKRFQSDVYVNCKPVHRSKCVPLNNFEISKEFLSTKNRNSFQKYSKKCNTLMNDSCIKAQKEFDKAKQEFVKFSDHMCSLRISKNSTR